MSSSYALISKYLTNLDLKHIDVEDFLSKFDTTSNEAVTELISYIIASANSYTPGSEIASLILKSSILIRTLLVTAEFKQDELESIKKKSTKARNRVEALKELEPTKSRKHHLNKTINIFEKMHFKVDRSDEKIFHILKNYIKNRVSADYIIEFASKYSGCFDEISNGITIYDYILEEALNCFPIKPNSYDIYYYLKLLKAFRKKAVILNDNSLKKINKLRNSKISKKEDILLLELIYLVNDEEYELSEEDVENKYGRKKHEEANDEHLATIYTPEEKKKTDLYVITIDPSLLALKDDGVSISRLGSDYLLGIHITNVSGRVLQGTLIDRIAHQNYKSYYEGAVKVHDMIDSKLSYPAFSFEEGKHMPSLSLYVIISKTGEIKDYYFDEDEIKVSKNLTYEIADNLLTLSTDLELASKLSDLLDVSELLKHKNNGETYRMIKDLINNCGFVDYSFSSHSIITESMVLYNHLMATRFSSEGLPFIYRVHNEPTDDDLLNIIALLTSGKDRPMTKGQARNELVSKVREQYPSAHYSTINLGHHGLGLNAYAHTTSPGRRYPDLIAQRMYHDLFTTPRTDEMIDGYYKLTKELCEYFNYASKIQNDYFRELALIKKK